MREGLHKIASDEETIVAIATPIGHSGLGVIRMSGRECQAVAQRFFEPHSRNSDLQHRVALIGSWKDAEGEQLDEVVVTFFKAPHSYTGEDVLEISAHGNPGVLRRIVENICGGNVRLAAPGEFTLRAVANAKMDLVQAEAVKEFIESQTVQQARTALRQMDGALSKHIRPIKDKLIDVIAQVEAGIDFADDDVPVPENSTITDRTSPLRLQLNALKETFGYGKILAKGLHLIILGKPNVGKSSLFNRLLSSDRAIVTAIAGTTRDVLRETISVAGVPLCLADTAGIRETTDEIENMGVSRTFEALSDADLALIVLDGSRMLDDDDRETLERGGRIPHLIVINKTDLPPALDVNVLNGAPRVFVSAKTGDGLEGLRAAVETFLLARKTSLNDDLVLTSARQHQAITTALEALTAAEGALSVAVPHEMVLLDLYSALGALDGLTGEVVTEDILERIFTTFCVGK